MFLVMNKKHDKYFNQVKIWNTQAIFEGLIATEDAGYFEKILKKTATSEKDAAHGI